MSFYDTPLWRKVRQRKLSRNPFCEVCRELGVRTPAVAVDHILAIVKGGHPTADGNLRSCCAPHHNSKTALVDMQQRDAKEFVVIGEDGFPVEMDKGVRVVYADSDEERKKVLGKIVRGEKLE